MLRARGRWYYQRMVGTLAILWLVVAAAVARAECECGYSAVVGRSAEEQIFTELIETDFTRVDDSDIAASADWKRQAFNLTNGSSRGRHGELFAIQNVRPNPDRDHAGRSGIGVNGQPSGLELVVGSDLVDGMVPVAEMDSARMDILWGTFRAGMKLSPLPGTCAAFFWYFNDTQEIDMEFLSSEFDASNNSFPVNLVLQSRAAAEKGYNAQATGNFKKAYLPFNPSLDFHEYRIDFLPDKVVFYADGEVLAEMGGSAVPTHSGHLILQNWSNGNPGWSKGPPEREAVITVSFVQAFFNSSTAARQKEWASKCRDATAVCRVPSRGDAQNPSFFSATGNTTSSQTGSGTLGRESRATQHSWVSTRWPTALSALSAAWLVGL